LRLAQERLQLFGDTRTAAQALQIASRQVAAIDNPLYLGLQRDIASAQQKLALVAGPDYPLIYNSIDQLQVSVLSLPFKGAGSIAAASDETAASPAATGWWARLRQAFSSLVTVRRDTGAEDQWPVMADQEMVRQQAWLELEVARLAAMRRDQDSWSAALQRLSATLQRWFEPSSPELQQAMSLLETLRPVNVEPVLPDISAPWAALQAIRASGVPIQPAETANPEADGETSPATSAPAPAEAAAPAGEPVDEQSPADGTE
jgi:uroporphyrin-3 C-methyltransferase